VRLQNYLNEETQKELVLAIGLPATGKSTYIKRNYPKHIILSNDFIIEKEAKKSDTDYNKAFDNLGLPKIIAAGKADFQKALKTNKSIVLDNTNLTKNIRKYYLDLAKGYKKIALVFTISMKEQKKRLAQRKGKIIPTEVLLKMKQQLELPSKSEGFVEIIKK
jgi:predicted kinase